MKISYVIALAMGLAATPLVSGSTPAQADGLGLFQRNKASQSTSHNRRAARPQVRGFLFQPGGFSYTIPDSYSHNYASEPPRDFGPYLDYGPTPGGIIPNDAYR